MFSRVGLVTTIIKETGLRRGWIHETHCSMAISTSLIPHGIQRATASDQQLKRASVVTIQVPIYPRESSLFSVLARKEGEEGRGLHPVECPCEMCDDWREEMIGASNEDDGMLNGFVVESEVEPESDVEPAESEVEPVSDENDVL